MSEEVWKSIEGFPNYEVSNLGQVRNKTKIKSQRVANKYYIVTLCNYGLKKNFKVHRLVALAFIPNSDNKPTIDHINKNKLDNRLENLRWFDYKEQANNRNEYPLQGTNTGEPFITFNKNYIFSKRGIGRKTFPTLQEAITFRDELLM